jgi:hypothetical protein
LKSLPNLLLIVGTDRNAGKTTLASRIIANTADKLSLVAVKISPHFHELGPEEKVVFKTDRCVIVRETLSDSGKDSARFLLAGASEVYYMQVWDHELEDAFNELLKICGPGRPMIVESGWLRNLVEPGLFIIVNRKGNSCFKESIEGYRKMEHIWIESDGNSFSPEIDKIDFLNGTWVSR